MGSTKQTRKATDELLPEVPARPVASPIRRPALLKPLETLDEIGHNGQRVPLLARLNDVIVRLNEIGEWINSQEQK